MFLEDLIIILEWILKDHVTLKKTTGYRKTYLEYITIEIS